MSVSKSASAIEGGEFHCYIHEFITSNPEEWYKHCEAKDKTGKPTHLDEGTGQCVFCHTANIAFKDIPWTRPGTAKGVVCDECRKSQLGVGANK